MTITAAVAIRHADRIETAYDRTTERSERAARRGRQARAAERARRQSTIEA